MFKPLRTNRPKGRHTPVLSLPPLAMPTTVEVRGRDRKLLVRVHPRAKRLTLRFNPRTGEGRVSVPPGTAPSAVIAFLSQNRGWIDAHAPDIIEESDAPFPDLLPLDGVPHLLVPTGRLRGAVEVRSDVGEPTIYVPGAAHRVMPRLAGFLKAEAKTKLTPIILRDAAKLGKTVSAIRFRDPRAQWGSCTSGRTVTLSWRVMMATKEAQNYLVAHEIAHLAHMNHSRAFWATVAELYPNWKTGQAALKAAEKELMRLRFS